VKAEGLQEGLQLGLQQGKTQIAINLLVESPSLSDAKIAKIIGCDLEMIKQLRKQLKN
jgi:hypothetical protein